MLTPFLTPDCKNTTDDALQNYLLSLPTVSQTNFHTDVKLALGYTAVVIAALTFYLDYTQGFEATKTLTTYAVIIYFALNGAFTYWIWGVEKDIVFTGHVGDKKIEFATRTDKFSPVYKLRVKVKTAKGSVDIHEVEKSFADWFTEDGFFVAKPFQRWLAGSVAVIGDVDTKNAKKGKTAVGEEGNEEGQSQGQTGSVTVEATSKRGVQDVLDTIKRDRLRAEAKASKRRV